MGGIETANFKDMSTTMPGLYAVGEAACVSITVQTALVETA